MNKYWTNYEEEQKTLDNMLTYGGSFVKQLAVLYTCGDRFNKAKLLETFRKYFDEYKNFGK